MSRAAKRTSKGRRGDTRTRHAAMNQGRKRAPVRRAGATAADPFFDSCDACERDLGGEAAVECGACGGRFCASCFGEHETCPALEARDMLDDLEREDDRVAEDIDDDFEEDAP